MAENQTVTVELLPDIRLRLYGQITARMEDLGYNLLDYSSLNLGIELPAEWPADVNAQPSLAELVVVAFKLKMKIIISDINLIPRKES